MMTITLRLMNETICRKLGSLNEKNSKSMRESHTKGHMSAANVNLCYYQFIYGNHASLKGGGAWTKYVKSLGHMPNGTGEIVAGQVKFPAHLPEGR